MLTDFELGWLVGLLEGEGYFGLNKVGIESVSFHFALEMNDEDVVVRAAELIGAIVGSPCVVREYTRSDGRVTYRLILYSTKAKALMEAVVRHMHERRRARIWQTLNGYVAPKRDLAELLQNIIPLKRKA